MNSSPNTNTNEDMNEKIPFKGELKIINRELANSLIPEPFMARIKGTIEKDNPGIKCARLAVDKGKQPTIGENQ